MLLKKSRCDIQLYGRVHALVPFSEVKTKLSIVRSLKCCSQGFTNCLSLVNKQPLWLSWDVIDMTYGKCVDARIRHLATVSKAQNARVNQTMNALSLTRHSNPGNYSNNANANTGKMPICNKRFPQLLQHETA